MSAIVVLAVAMATCMFGARANLIPLTPDHRSNVTSFTVNSVSTKLEVEKGSTVTFVCEAEGNAVPRLTIVGQRSNMSVPLTFTPNGDFVNVAEGEMKMYCNSTDLYFCIPSMNQTPGTRKNVTVSVKCEPELNTTATTTKYFSTEEGNVLEMKFIINAYPIPDDYTLIQTGNETIRPDRKKREIREVQPDYYQVTYVPMEPPQGVVILQMYGLDSENSGQYSLNVKNGIGGGLEINFNVNVQKEDDDDDDTDIHTIIGTVCGVIGAVGVIIPGMICAVRKCRSKA